MTIAEAIYLLCAATSLIAAVLLLRQYVSTRTPLLFWSFAGFIGLAVSNVLVFVEAVAAPEVDLAVPRALAAAIGMGVLLCGLIVETR